MSQIRQVQELSHLRSAFEVSLLPEGQVGVRAAFSLQQRNQRAVAADGSAFKNEMGE